MERRRVKGAAVEERRDRTLDADWWNVPSSVGKGTVDNPPRLVYPGATSIMLTCASWTSKEEAPMTASDHEAITQALAAGHLTVPDPATGYQRTMYAACPNDGELAPIRRVVRGSGGAITQVTMRCLRCGREFTPPAEALTLH